MNLADLRDRVYSSITELILAHVEGRDFEAAAEIAYFAWAIDNEPPPRVRTVQEIFGDNMIAHYTPIPQS